MSGEYLGDFVGTETMVVVFDTFGTNGESLTLTGLATTDIEIYKGSSVTQRASDAGYTLIDTDGIDIDTVTGIHGFTVDLSDNTDPGFYATGNDYYIVVNSVTINSQTVSFIAARFSIQNRYMRGTDVADVNAQADTALVDFFTSPATLVDLMWDESMAAHQTALTSGRAVTLGGVPIAETTATGTPTSTSVQLTAGSAIDNYYANQPLKILSGSGAGQVRPIISYTGATKTCTLDEGFAVAPSAGDVVAIGVEHIHPVSEISAQVMTDLDANGSTVIDAILTDTGTTIPAQIAALNDPTAAAIAAAVYTYNMGNSRTIGEALAFLRNKWTIVGTTLTVYDTDDTTVLWTSTVATTAGDPVSSSDPA